VESASCSPCPAARHAHSARGLLTSFSNGDGLPSKATRLPGSVRPITHRSYGPHSGEGTTDSGEVHTNMAAGWFSIGGNRRARVGRFYVPHRCRHCGLVRTVNIVALLQVAFPVGRLPSPPRRARPVNLLSITRWQNFTTERDAMQHSLDYDTAVQRLKWHVRSFPLKWRNPPRQARILRNQPPPIKCNCPDRRRLPRTYVLHVLKTQTWREKKDS
jgi:hypothetical protein